MADHGTVSARELIEAAMERAAKEKARQSTGTQYVPLPERLLSRQAYEQELARRREQLRIALGDDGPPAREPHAAAAPTPEPTPETVSAPPAAPATANLALVTPDRLPAAGRLMLTSILSALAGAGLTWLLLGPGGQDHPSPAVPAQGQPAATTPAPQAPTTVGQTPVSAAAANPAPVPAVQSTPAEDTEERVRAALERWRNAWSNRDVETYLRSYAPDFRPDDGQSHAEWAAARSRNLSGRSGIDVKIRDVEIERDGDDRVKVRFVQDYASDSYRENARPKVLTLARDGSGWLIVGERQGTAATRRAASVQPK